MGLELVYRPMEYRYHSRIHLSNGTCPFFLSSRSGTGATLITRVWMEFQEGHLSSSRLTNDNLLIDTTISQNGMLRERQLNVVIVNAPHNVDRPLLHPGTTAPPFTFESHSEPDRTIIIRGL